MAENADHTSKRVPPIAPPRIAREASLRFSSFVGGSDIESSAAIGIGPSGAVYIAGQTTSADFPVQNPLFAFKGGLILGTDTYVAKLANDGASFEFSSFFGGSSDEIVSDLAVNASGSVFIAGTTASNNLPMKNALYAYNGGNELFSDGFISVINTDGSALEFSTFLGGTGDDIITALALGPDGSIFVTGSTSSDDFPITPGAYQPLRTDVAPTVVDAFVVKLEPTGNMQFALGFATYLGGNGDDVPTGIAVDSEGQAWITGFTSSFDFPTRNAVQNQFGGPIREREGDSFVVRFSVDGAALDFSSFLGGAQNDQTTGIEVDAADNVFVTGFTESNDFPTTVGAMQMDRAGIRDRFVTMFSRNGAQSWTIDFSTYLGSASFEMGIAGLVVDRAGRVWIAGATDAATFPTRDPDQALYGGGETDAFISRLDAVGSMLGYSTYLGGTGSEVITGIALGTDTVCFTGSTGSENFPVQDALQPLFDGPVVAGLKSSSAFVSCFNTINEAPILSELSVSPDSVALIAGQVQQFAANGLDQFGQPLGVAPQWSATGGSIDALGQYSAGDDAGIFSVTATDPSTGLMESAIVNIVSGVNTEPGADLPTEFALFANYPNPFNPETVIRFDVKASVEVRLTLFDALGRRIETLLSERHVPGRYSFRFDGSAMASGVYFYEIEMGDFRAVKQMVLMR